MAQCPSSRAMLLKRKLIPLIRYILPLVLASTLIGVLLKNAPFVLPGHILRRSQRDLSTVPIIYLVTPTYTRSTQAADLTRLAQTLMLVKDIHWIVVEDSVRYSRQVKAILDRSRIPYTHLLGPRPPDRRARKFGRGVSNRLKALSWLKDNATMPSILYFADDDNSYDIRLFDEIRRTKKVSVFPVGLIFSLGVSSPIVKNGKVVGFHDPYTPRKFMLDMAGFAVNMELIKSNPNVTMPYQAGMEEDLFLRSLNVTIADLEPLANNCTEVLVWHTKTSGAPSPNVKNVPKKVDFNHTNLRILYKNMLS